MRVTSTSRTYRGDTLEPKPADDSGGASAATMSTDTISTLECSTEWISCVLDWVDTAGLTDVVNRTGCDPEPAPLASAP